MSGFGDKNYVLLFAQLNFYLETFAHFGFAKKIIGLILPSFSGNMFDLNLISDMSEKEWASIITYLNRLALKKKSKESKQEFRKFGLRTLKKEKGKKISQAQWSTPRYWLCCHFQQRSVAIWCPFRFVLKLIVKFRKLNKVFLQLKIKSLNFFSISNKSVGNVFLRCVNPTG